MVYPDRRNPGRAGHSLVEMLVSMAILLLVVSSVVSAMMLGESSGRLAVQSTDQNQQLRAAIKQLSEDFAYGRLHGTPVNGRFALSVGQPVWTRSSPYGRDWSGISSDWKGDLTEWAPLTVEYELIDGALRRTVWSQPQYGDPEQYGQTYVISGLDTDPTNTYIRPGPNHRIEVRLSMRPAGGSRLVAVYNEFFARPS